MADEPSWQWESLLLEGALAPFERGRDASDADAAGAVSRQTGTTPSSSNCSASVCSRAKVMACVRGAHTMPRALKGAHGEQFQGEDSVTTNGCRLTP
eukprot:1778393-Pleurochrysis_carterae.AAC.1